MMRKGETSRIGRLHPFWGTIRRSQMTSRIAVVAFLFVVSACREANPEWDPERQAMTQPGDDSDDAGESEETSAAPMCEEHQTLCGDECVDLLSTPEHCGACFEPCRPPDRVCEEGECVR
jgi:hypothetical protein